MKRFLQLVASIGLSLAAGGLGSLAVLPNIASWYAGLEKPPLIPPNEVFGPVWNVLYVLMGISFFLVWISPKVNTRACVAFVAQLTLNAIWSWTFFGLHLPWLGLVVIILLAAAIIWTIKEFLHISRIATWLLSPYLAWVLFATYLTVGVSVLN